MDDVFPGRDKLFVFGIVVHREGNLYIFVWCCMHQNQKRSMFSSLLNLKRGLCDSASLLAITVSSGSPEWPSTSGLQLFALRVG